MRKMRCVGEIYGRSGASEPATTLNGDLVANEQRASFVTDTALDFDEERGH